MRCLQCVPERNSQTLVSPIDSFRAMIRGHLVGTPKHSMQGNGELCQQKVGNAYRFILNLKWEGEGLC